MKLAIILSTLFALSSAITIDCNFRTIFLTMESAYGCDGTATIDGSSQISSINGNHQAGKTNNDTKVFRVWNDCTLESVPEKVGEFFPNLIALWFNDCKFKEIEDDDFVDLENLVELDLAYNQMEFVHEKAFVELKKLQFLYLNNNQIIYIGPNVVQTLPSLVYVTLEDNSCISSNSFNFEDSDVRNFVIDIAIQCPLTMKIAETLLNIRRIQDSKNYIKDLREVMDNAMMVDNDDEEEVEEARFDYYESLESSDESRNLNIKESLEEKLEEAKIQEISTRLSSKNNKFQEDKKVAVKNNVLKHQHS